jgi:hypothetical protein
MANLQSYINKYGRREGKKKYNAWHREYRQLNIEKMRKYWRTYRAARKAAEIGAK